MYKKIRVSRWVMGHIQNIGFSKYNEGKELRLDVTRSIFNRQSLDVGVFNVDQGVGVPIDVHTVERLTELDLSNMDAEPHDLRLSLTEKQLSALINALSEWADDVRPYARPEI